MKTTKPLWAAAIFVAACGSGDGALTSSGNSSVDGDGESTGSPGSSGKGPSLGQKMDEGICETHSVASRKTTPDMLIVLDRSASTAPIGNPNGADRWSGSVDAIVQVTREFDSQINFGLMTFPAFDPATAMPVSTGNILDDLIAIGSGFAQVCAPGTVNVDIGKGTAAEIESSLGVMTPGGLTPTSATLEAALDLLDEPAAGDQSLPPRYVLLVTDGDPNCSEESRGGGGGEVDMGARQGTLAAIEKLKNAGIQTFVVGYQTEGTNFAQQLDQMAEAGGTGDTRHRSVSSGADLIDTFAEIAGRALSCSFKLDEPVEDANYVRVTVKGQTPRPGEGWTLGDDMRTVTLTGESCDDVQAGSSFTVEVDCDPVFYQ